VEVTVQDNGIGIAKDIQSKVFDPFFTTRLGSGGSGIGLSIVHSLATQGLEGTVRLKSSLGAGCKLTFVIPKTVGRVAGHCQSD
jgi:signal transduction histidine kinase